MLATFVRESFHKPGWIYEEKYDGERILAYKQGRKVRLLSRNGIDRTDRFPHIAAVLRNLRAASLLLDGEMVVFDRHNISRFQLLQQGKGKTVYAVFDCLFQAGKDLRSDPLSARRAALEESIDPDPLLPTSHKLAQNGLEAFRIAKRRGYEGLVAKNLSSTYQSGRSTSWLKVKVHEQDEFLIVGYTKPTRSRKYFGALLLGAFDGAKLRYVGKVGTGFDAQMLSSIYRRIQPLSRQNTTLVDAIREPRLVFIAPRLVAQISYQEWTEGMKLRQPVFLGLRSDKRPHEVFLPEARQ